MRNSPRIYQIDNSEVNNKTTQAYPQGLIKTDIDPGKNGLSPLLTHQLWGYRLVQHQQQLAEFYLENTSVSNKLPAKETSVGVKYIYRGGNTDFLLGCADTSV